MEKTSFFLVVVLSFVLFLGCGLKIKETSQTIETMDIEELYRAGVDYYSKGFIEEAKFFYIKAIEKYETLGSPNKRQKEIYAWCLYEIGFIEYANENYTKASEIMDKVMNFSAEEIGKNSAQYLLSRKIKFYAQKELKK